MAESLMGIQKLISRPSPTSIRRGMKTMASLNRKLHYLASEHGRESCVLINQEGKELAPSSACEQMGGPKAPYVEVMSDLSRVETEALIARFPGRDQKEIVQEFFCSQLRGINKSGDAVLAIHGESDGSFHCHGLLRGTKDDYANLEGQRGAPQKAFNRAWAESQDQRIRDWKAFEEIRPAVDTLKGLKAEERALVAERKNSKKYGDPANRIERREAIAETSRLLEERMHEAELAKARAIWKARGQEDGLEHLVDIERESHRHAKVSRIIEAERLGLDHYRARLLDVSCTKYGRNFLGIPRKNGFESFRSLGVEQRREFRESALKRELAVLERKHEFERASGREGLTQRHAAENRIAHLRFKIGCLKDQEDALKGKASLPQKSEIMKQRHELEREALEKKSASVGKMPTPQMVTKLDERHAVEKKSMKSRGGSFGKLASLGRMALPTEARTMVAVGSQTAKTAVDTAAKLIRLDVVGSVASLGKGALNLTKTAGKGAQRELGVTIKGMGLLTKIPVIGLPVAVTKLATEIVSSVGNAASQEVER